jgi:hypothetical protein
MDLKYIKEDSCILIWIIPDKLIKKNK